MRTMPCVHSRSRWIGSRLSSSEPMILRREPPSPVNGRCFGPSPSKHAEPGMKAMTEGIAPSASAVPSPFDATTMTGHRPHGMTPIVPNETIPAPPAWSARAVGAVDNRALANNSPS